MIFKHYAENTKTPPINISDKSEQNLKSNYAMKGPHI